MDKPLTIFKNRLAKIGIDVELEGNFPWIYLSKINGKRVIEKLDGNHGFTVAWYGGAEVKFNDLEKTFNLLRKYREDDKLILVFLNWLKKEDTQENAEKYFGYLNKDMLIKFREVYENSTNI